MTELSQLEKDILCLLSFNQPIFINELAQLLDVPVYLIQESIDKLMAVTDIILSSKKDYFQLNAPYFPIKKTNLEKALNPIGFEEIYTFDSLHSTNQFLKENKKLTTPVLCHSDMQTAGRGRQGRKWFSPFATNLYFSIKYPMPSPISKCAGLSLMLGYCLVKAIENLLGTKKILLKWPNDLIYNKKKLAGILIETSENFIIMGIGINVNCLSQNNPIITKPWTSLREIYEKPISREQLLIKIVQEIHENTKIFFKNGFSVFHEKWLDKDAFHNQPISVLRGDELIEGLAKGITKNGNLLVLNALGELLEIESGELS